MRTTIAILLLASMLAGCAEQPTPRTPSNDVHNDQKWRDAGWVSVAVGSAAGVVALGTGYVMLHDQSVRDSNCSNNACNQQGLDASSQLTSLVAWITGAWIVTAVGLGVGAFLVITHPPREHDKNEPQPPADKGPREQPGTTAVGVTPNGLTLRSTF
jgi:uncharacterized membrane protein